MWWMCLISTQQDYDKLHRVVIKKNAKMEVASNKSSHTIAWSEFTHLDIDLKVKILKISKVLNQKLA